jgi:hypothetical protein
MHAGLSKWPKTMVLPSPILYQRFSFICSNNLVWQLMVTPFWICLFIQEKSSVFVYILLLVLRFLWGTRVFTTRGEAIVEIYTKYSSSVRTNVHVPLPFWQQLNKEFEVTLLVIGTGIEVLGSKLARGRMRSHLFLHPPKNVRENWNISR